MRAVFILTLVLMASSSAFGMSTKEKVRLLLWSKGIKENPRPQTNVYTWPEEIEKPLRKF